MKKIKKKKKKGKAHKGPCFKKGCARNGGTIHECLTCVQTGKTPPFSVQCCQDHWHEGLTKVKRHALVKHPANILRVTAAGLRGEEI